MSLVLLPSLKQVQCEMIFSVKSELSHIISSLQQRTRWNVGVLTARVFYWQFLITYIFSVSLKFGAFYIMGQWGKFSVKKVNFSVHIFLWHFWFLLFIKNVKNLCFHHFHLFFLMKYQISATEYLPVWNLNWRYWWYWWYCNSPWNCMKSCIYIHLYINGLYINLEINLYI